MMCKTKNNKNINKIVQIFVQTSAIYEQLNCAYLFGLFWSKPFSNVVSNNVQYMQIMQY